MDSELDSLRRLLDADPFNDKALEEGFSLVLVAAIRRKIGETPLSWPRIVHLVDKYHVRCKFKCILASIASLASRKGREEVPEGYDIKVFNAAIEEHDDPESELLVTILHELWHLNLKDVGLGYLPIPQKIRRRDKYSRAMEEAIEQEAAIAASGGISLDQLLKLIPFSGPVPHAGE